jgi:hypothetical protein
MSKIAEAKSCLPMPGLLAKIGLGDRAKKSALCPLHEEKRPSFGIFKGDNGQWHFKCHSCGAGGDEIEFLEAYEKLSQEDAIHRYLDLAGVNGAAPRSTTPDWQPGKQASAALDWQRCVEAFTDKHVALLVQWRGFSPEFVRELHGKKLIGTYQGRCAFPIQNNGSINACHCCEFGTKNWLCLPKGNNIAPMVLGELVPGEHMNVFESTWDGLMYLDKSGERDGVIITRGSSNGKFVCDLAPKNSTLYLWTQNDKPGEKWQRVIVENAKCAVKRAKIPAQYKDLCDWVRVGARVEDFLDAIVQAEILLEGERGLSMRSPDEILAMPRDPNANYLGDRLFAKGQPLAICGVGGIGKSRLLLQLLACLITGRPWLGIETHAREFSATLIQTENGIDRLQREIEALKHWLGNDWPQVNSRLQIHTLETDTDSLLHLSDPHNAARLEEAIKTFNPVAVAFDPLRDVSIGDLNSDADMTATLRELGRIARLGRPDRGIIILHHAIAGKAGAAKAFGLERTGFGRNSKVLHLWARGMINVIPGAEDNNDTLILTCGKNSNGREFAPFAVTLNPDSMVYEVAEDFDVESWRENVAGRPSSRQTTLRPQIVIEIPWSKPELTKKELVKSIMDETGCQKTRAYCLVDQSHESKLLKFSKTTRTYAKA